MGVVTDVNDPGVGGVVGSIDVEGAGVGMVVGDGVAGVRGGLGVGGQW